MRIALISCSKEKKSYACPAHELYSASKLFLLSYRYAKLNADKIYILSAKYGLVDEDRIVSPYNNTLQKMSRQEQLSWASTVISDLRKECNLATDMFILLAGNTYCRDLIQFFQNYAMPLDGLRMGERMARLKELVNGTSHNSADSMCDRLHKLLCNLPRYSWNQISQIPFTNGIYIVFEKGEQHKEMDRIVRVGTHTSSDRLKTRLMDHFIRENHDGSIFRKNVGKAILNSFHDPYLSIWTIDTSKSENRRLINKEKNAETERKVSSYLHDRCSFSVFQVSEKDERLRMEEAIIATLNADPDFKPSAKWLGLYSPEVAIQESGLWLKRGLNGKPISETEIKRLTELCNQSNLSCRVKKTAESTGAPCSRIITEQSCGKYELLFQFLKRQTANQIIMTYSEVEAILGFKLPNSAYKYTNWWNPHVQPHCQAWLQAGFEIANASEVIQNKMVVFSRIDDANFLLSSQSLNG